MRNPDKKPRGDSKLDALDPAAKEQLCRWLTVDNLTYAKAKEQLRAEFGITTNNDALHRFYGQVAAPWQYASAAGEADSFAQLMAGRFDEATIKKAKQLAFTALTSRKPDLKTAKVLLKIVGDSAKVSIAQDKLTLDGRRIVLLEKKAAQADKTAEILGNKSISEEEQAKQVRNLFGMG